MSNRGGWPGHVLTTNLRAPFIHGFIVDEWERAFSLKRKERVLNGARLIEGELEVKDLTGPPAQ